MKRDAKPIPLLHILVYIVCMCFSLFLHCLDVFFFICPLSWCVFLYLSIVLMCFSLFVDCFEVFFFICALFWCICLHLYIDLGCFSLFLHCLDVFFFILTLFCELCFSDVLFLQWLLSTFYYNNYSPSNNISCVDQCPLIFRYVVRCLFVYVCSY